MRIVSEAGVAKRTGPPWCRPVCRGDLSSSDRPHHSLSRFDATDRAAPTQPPVVRLL